MLRCISETTDEERLKTVPGVDIVNACGAAVLEWLDPVFVPFCCFGCEKMKKITPQWASCKFIYGTSTTIICFFCVGMLLVCVLGKTISFAFLVQLPTSFQNLIS